MNASRYIPTLLAVAVICASPAIASSASPGPLRASASPGSAQRLLALRRAKAVRTKSWLKRDAASSGPLVYASLITSISTGETNIYQQSGSTLTLIGQLSEGGGPIATDANGNVYVAESGSNVLGFVPRNVYVYQPGATSPSLVLENPDYMSWAIAVSSNGTVYVAGLSVAAYGAGGPTATGVMEYHLPSAIPTPPASGPPSSITGTLLPPVTANPATPIGMAADSTGNVFASWSPSTASPCSVGYLFGCGTELAANGSRWKTYLPLGTAVNGIVAGPVLAANESQIIVTGGSGPWDFLITFAKGAYIPSQVTALPLTGAQGIPSVASIAVDSGGHAIWAINGGNLEAPPPYNIWKLEYPSGSVTAIFTIPQGSPSSPSGFALPLGTDYLAVGPAYAP